MQLTTLLTTLAALSAVASAQSTTAALPNPTTATGNAAPGAASDGYAYVGCWNETTGFTASGGVRALAGGSMVMQPPYHMPALEEEKKDPPQD